MQQSVSVSASPEALHAGWWPQGWWKIMALRIGIVPIPIYVILVAVLAVFTYTGDIKGEVSTMIAVLVIGGFTCAEIGKRIPVLRNIGAAAIFATFVPSALAYYKLLPPQIEKSVVEFTKYTNFLYLFIACIIVGSILGMDPQSPGARISENIRAVGGRLDRRRNRRHAHRHLARHGRLSYLLLCCNSHHGRRCR